MCDVRWLTVFGLLLMLAGCASTPATDQPEAQPETASSLTGEALVSLNNRALSLKEEGRFQEAAALLREGLQSAPETPELHYNLAVISELYLLDLTTALDHYRNYQALIGESADQPVSGWIADLERRLQ